MFRDFLARGSASPYRDLFITPGKFWTGGIRNESDIAKIFLRRPYPLSTYETASGPATVWTTFGKTNPSEQIDIDVWSNAAWDFFNNVFKVFSSHGIRAVRLDAIGYVIKKPGTTCFFVEPEVYDFLDHIASLANRHGLILLPELHADFESQRRLAARGGWIYDFVLPYRVLEAIFLKDFTNLGVYLRDRPTGQFTTLDCHDGLPILPDLNGLVKADAAQRIVDLCMDRGSNLSYVMSDAHKMPDGFDVHQIRGTLYSMLGEKDNDFIAARAIQLFTPGIPMIYYVGLLAGSNAPLRMERTGDGREISRHNFSVDEIRNELLRPVVQRLLRLIRFRNENPVFEGTFSVENANRGMLALLWEKGDDHCRLTVNALSGETIIEQETDGKRLVSEC
jgi:sucrose phosphorylase